MSLRFAVYGLLPEEYAEKIDSLGSHPAVDDIGNKPSVLFDGRLSIVEHVRQHDEIRWVAHLFVDGVE